MALAGAMEGVDAVFGTHVFGVVPAGKVAIHAGPMLAGSGSFKVTFHGKGGHGAQPHMSIDTITPACMAFMGIQGIVNKEIPASDAAVVNVCQIHGGTRGNVITDTCWLEGTFRYYKPELGDIISQAIQRIADAAAQATRTTVDVECRIGVGPTVNDAALAELAKEVAAKEIGPDAAMEFEPIMGSEDFSVFSNMVPGMFVGIGAGSPKDGIMWPNHHPLFDIDEDCLDVAVRMYVGFAKAYLEK
jgi:amidohydrolase